MNSTENAGAMCHFFRMSITSWEAIIWAWGLSPSNSAFLINFLTAEDEVIKRRGAFWFGTGNEMNNQTL